MTTTATQTREQQRTCDNCALMTLLLCGDGLLHRHCDEMNLFIADWNVAAVCNLHRWIANRKGGRR